MSGRRNSGGVKDSLTRINGITRMETRRSESAEMRKSETENKVRRVQDKTCGGNSNAAAEESGQDTHRMKLGYIGGGGVSVPSEHPDLKTLVAWKGGNAEAETGNRTSGKRK